METKVDIEIFQRTLQKTSLDRLYVMHASYVLANRTELRQIVDEEIKKRLNKIRDKR